MKAADSCFEPAGRCDEAVCDAHGSRDRLGEGMTMPDIYDTPEVIEAREAVLDECGHDCQTRAEQAAALAALERAVALAVLESIPCPADHSDICGRAESLKAEIEASDA